MNVQNFYNYGNLFEAGATQINNYYGSQSSTAHPQLPAKLSRGQAETLFVSLKQKGFLGADATLDSWLQVMGCQMAQKWSPVSWMKTKETLRLLLTGIYADELEHKTFKQKDLTEMTARCFVDGKGNFMQLAKPKTENSIDTDYIEQLISDLKKSEDITD